VRARHRAHDARRARDLRRRGRERGVDGRDLRGVDRLFPIISDG
jgi:hypothetical protein